MIQETGGSFTNFMGVGFGSSLPGLPSWVRDFSQTNIPGAIAGEERRIWNIALYHASSAQPLPVRWDENKELHYQGMFVDKVKVVGPSIFPEGTSSKPGFGGVLCQWLDICKGAIGVCKPTVLRHTFSRIICGDVCMSIVRGEKRFRRTSEADFPDEDAWWRLIRGDLTALDMRGYGWGLNFAMWGRCFFATDAGRMGLCYPNTLPKDEVWIMRGVQVPFILRPVVCSKGEQACVRSLVGDCFLSGVMDGQLSEEEKLLARPIIIR